MIQMGVFQASKNLSLLAGNSRNVQEKGKQRGKHNNNTDSKLKEKQNPSDGASSFKIFFLKKIKFSYCMRGFHPKSQCMKKTIHQLFESSSN